MTGKQTPVHAALADVELRRLLAEALAAYLRIELACHDTAAEALKAAPAPGVLLLDHAAERPENPALLVLTLDRLPVRAGDILSRVAAHLQGNAMRWKSGAAEKIGPWRFSPGDLSLRGKKDNAVHLTEKERDILLLLLERRGKPVTRGELLKAVWGYGGGMETHTLETDIYRLRRKLEDDPAKPLLLLTEESGYRLAE